MAKVDSMITPTPTDDATLTRRYADFDTLVDAVEYAAKGVRGMNFYDARGNLYNSMTWRETRDKAEAVGRKLVAMGFEKNDRIALIAETTAEFIIFFLGCQYASVLPVPLPLPTSFGAKDGYIVQLQNQMNSCQANAIMAPSYMTELVTDGSKGMGLRFIGSLEDYLAHEGDAEVRLPTVDDLAYLQYSSGSTRFPHGVSVTHTSLLSNTYGMGFHGVQLGDGDRCVSWLPFYHDMGLVGMFLTSLCCQVSVDFLATEDFARRPITWLKIMSKNKGTCSYSPTFGYEICARRVRSDALAELDLSSWRVAGNGGDMIRPEVMSKFHEAFKDVGFSEKAFVPSYGLAECTLAVSFAEVGKGLEVDLVDESLLGGDTHVLVSGTEDAERQRSVVNCGKPLPEFDVEIRNTEDQALPERYVGRVYVKGVSVMRDYYNDPKSTADVLKDGWLDTGDMGYMLDGCIYIVGRAKDMIIVNGKNHWPQDIEWAAEQVEGVRNGDVAAVSVPGENNEELPMILAHCRFSDPVERAKFAELLKKHVMKITGVTCLVELVAPRSLPRTSSGKLSRAKARSQYLDGKLKLAG